MRDSQRRYSLGRRVLLAALLMTLTAAQGTGTAAATDASANATPASTAQTAHWVKKKLFFVYAGLQTQYVCQGLTDQMRKVLLQLGARKAGLDVHETGCTAGFNQPTPSPGVAGSFYVLEPVSPEQADSSNGAPGSVAAHWQPVQVRLDPPGRDVNGQCELLDQIKLHILPLFPTRNVQYKSTCIPYEEIVGGTSLRLEVLMPSV